MLRQHDNRTDSSSAEMANNRCQDRAGAQHKISQYQAKHKATSIPRHRILHHTVES